MNNSKSTYFDTRQIVELTGISEFTLRGWEGRYGALQPTRTETGRRQYTRDDILKIRCLLDLTNRGHRIGTIAQLPIAKLHKLLEETDQISLFPDEQVAANPTVEKISASLQKIDHESITKVMRNYRQTNSGDDFIFNLVMPLLKDLALNVQAGNINVVQEHLITMAIKENLYAIRSALRPQKNKQLVITATPEGDFHELGALIADTLLSLNGINSIYLGPHVPKADLCETVIRCEATHLLVASTASPEEGAKDDALTLINFLDRHLPKKCTLWLGGKNVSSLTVSLKREFKIIQSMEELNSLLGANKTKRGS